LLNFLVCLPMNFIDNEALWLTPSYQHVSWAQNQPSLQDLLNQNENKNWPNLKSKLWNKKTRTRHVRNKNPTIFYCKEEIKNKTRLWQENVPKTNVEQTKSN
jgi:hypothetical protein